MEWQPIETAPKDGKQILLYRKGAVYPGPTQIGWWNAKWHPFNSNTPTGRWDGGPTAPTRLGPPTSPNHWMPLPLPPEGPPDG